MYAAKVIGNVVATTKDPSLQGKKILVVEKLNEKQEPTGSTEVAIDTVGAGNGEHVLVTKGSAARLSSGKSTVIDAAIIAIIDTMEIEN